ncbi:anti-sigma regulatory factor [Gloeobacter kilaueensis]|uniref:Anti-sigma regulatory factor, serine/threonine protein kinase n=1 Tax=Gloeobacter kilaueensis (strain ATCC BAA-2537 / CCAP 1431/1 / ULC 316 / JS1) TaxID=1183438 RepID=U5QI84_GLOK1|nr:anti-sigma regulatory factor [Gloeobacter kilaueensis]AGY57350.1 anti-sigma regulatory factor, serine/threonine protein kinase [Gloeobacter kilaueensis JS1]
MIVEGSEKIAIRQSGDIVRVRQIVRHWSVRLRFSIVDQTKLVTAASELARNTFEHGGGGICVLESLMEGARAGLRLRFEDEGPGIANVDLALKDGYTTGSGMGLGLGGARRLVDEFAITSHPGQGTQVTITRWR